MKAARELHQDLCADARERSPQRDLEMHREIDFPMHDGETCIETPAEQAAFLLDVVYRQLSERITAPSPNDSVVIGLPLALRLFEAIRFSKGVLAEIGEKIGEGSAE